MHEPQERVTSSPPLSETAPSFRHGKLGDPAKVYTYLDADRELLGYICRYEPPGQRKEFRPLTWAESDGWQWLTFSAPRPLYGLDLLAFSPDAQVIVTEGEKACEAARVLFPDIVVVTWPGGAQAVKHVDWTPLRGRDVLIWRDADAPGVQARDALTALLYPIAKQVRWIEPEDDRPEKWDAADLKLTGDEADEWVRGRICGAVLAPAPLEQKQSRASASVTPITEARTARQEKPAPEPAPETVALAEDTLAHMFSSEHPELRYVARWSQWLEWQQDAGRWIVDEKLHVLNMARSLCAREADRSLSSERAKEPVVRKAKSAAVRSAVENLARADPRHAAIASQWDADPWALNTPAGIVDLRTGERRPGRLEDYATKCTAVAPGGECPTWLAFLRDVTAGDADLAAFLQRMAGYCLTGDVREHALFFAYGTGGNGKGTFLNTLSHVMGDYSKNARSETFMEGVRGSSHSQEIASLRGQRLVTVQEVKSGEGWNEQRIKELTGGDKLTARFLYQNEFDFMPTFKLVFSGNHKPSFKNIDEAIRRRLYLIPFTVTVPPERKDKDLGDKLRAESAGILEWALEGCRQWIERKSLDAPRSVREATDDYLQSQDLIAQWMDAECVLGRLEATPVAFLYSKYRDWTMAASEPYLKRGEWVDAMAQRGFHKKSTGRLVVINGVGLPRQKTGADYRSDDPSGNSHYED